MLTCIQLHPGMYRHWKRVCTKSWSWEKNPLPHRGIEPAPTACYFDPLPAELQPYLNLKINFKDQEVSQTQHQKCHSFSSICLITPSWNKCPPQKKTKKQTNKKPTKNPTKKQQTNKKQNKHTLASCSQKIRTGAYIYNFHHPKQCKLYLWISLWPCCCTDESPLVKI